MTFKYELLQNRSLVNPYIVNSIAVYFLTDNQIAKEPSLLPVIHYKRWTKNLANKLLKYKRFAYITKSIYFKDAKQLITEFGDLRDYDDQFIWLHETNQIGCNVMNYFKLIAKSSGYKINKYLAQKKCKCWRGTKYHTNLIIQDYIKNNNTIGLRTYFQYDYNLYRPDWEEYLYLCRFYDVDEEITDMIKMRM